MSRVDVVLLGVDLVAAVVAWLALLSVFAWRPSTPLIAIGLWLLSGVRSVRAAITPATA